MRVLALVLVLGAAAIGAAGLASWLDPWSLFGRFAAYDLQSVLRLAAREDLPGLVPSTVLASGAAVAAILAASFASGRWFCGNLCPVGSTLGLLNSLAPLRLRLDSGECIACGECASVCRASCVDSAAKRLDPSRCVYCLACLEVCPTGALYYGRPRPAPSAPASSRISRARFLAALGGGAAALMVALVPGRAFASKALGVRATGLGAPFPVLPPGARSLERFVGTCVACGACISVCPSRVLQPSLGQLGLIGLMAPRLDHGVSYCQYDCIACIDACPSGALGRMGLERKRLTKIGDATLVRDRCIVITNLTKCGACAECCPTGAVRMVAAGDGLPEPVFTSSICIGCGACHHACPVRPDRAISVSGLAVQALAEPPSTKLFDQGPSVPAAGGAGTAKGAVKDAFPF
jgi:ferredoxin